MVLFKKVNAKYYVMSKEVLPPEFVKSKNYIQKVMFLFVVTRPRRLSTGEYWDGKLGIWPLVEYSPALRNTVNRIEEHLLSIHQI